MLLNQISLYIHIPFCKKRCSYCDFVSESGNSELEIDNYVADLVGEIKLLSAWIGRAELDTIYIGGGTPSLLSLHNLQKLFSVIENNFLLSETTEFTIEANPGSISKTKLEFMLTHGINRLSLGVQSFNDAELQALGRIHRAKDALAAVEIIETVGLKNWSLDLMYGIPLQTIVSWTKTLQQAISLQPKHISVYELSIEQGSKFFNNRKIIAQLPDELLLEKIVKNIKPIFTNAGYYKYEISNYAQAGYQSKHNSKYWKNYNFIGLGLGAWSYLTNIRWQNPTSFLEYQKFSRRNVFLPVKNNKAQIDYEIVSLQIQLQEYIMLSLRTAEGIVLSEISERFAVDFEKEYKKIIKELIDNKLINRTKYGYKLSERGEMIAHTIIEKFF